MCFIWPFFTCAYNPRLICCAIFLGWVGFFPVVAHAGAWLQPAGQAYYSQSATFFYSDGFYDRQGKHQDSGQFAKYELNPYVEYGAASWMTVGASLFIQQIAQEFDRNAFINQPGFGPIQINYRETLGNYALADSELFARFKFYDDGQNIVSLEPLVKFPSWHEFEYGPRGGTEEWDTELGLLAGRSFKLYGLYHFWDSRLAYRHRGGELGDQYSADLKLGIRTHPRLLFVPALYATFAEDVPSDTAFFRDATEDYDLLKAELTTVFRLTTTLSAHATFFSHIKGKNVGDGEGVSLGFSTNF